MRCSARPRSSCLCEDDGRELSRAWSGGSGRCDGTTRVWTDPEEFREWSTGGTAKVLFANWIEQTPSGRAALQSEVRVEAIGVQGRVGLAAVRPLVGTFGNLIGSDGIEAAVRLAERR